MKRKIYYIGADFILSGSTFVMLDLLNNLDRDKFEVYYFAKSAKNFEQFGLNTDVHIIPLYKLRNRTWSRGIIFKGRGWIKVIREIRANADVLMVDHRSIITPLIRMRKIINFKCKFIIRWGNIPAYTIKANSKEHKFYRQYLKYIDKVIVPSVLSKKLFCDFFQCEDQKVKVVYNSLNKNRFSEPPLQLHEKSSLSDVTKPINLLYVGLMIPRKDPFCLLKAFEILSSELPSREIRVNFVGDGELFGELSEKIDLSPHKNNITLARAINDPSTLFNNSDIFVHTSHFDGFGIVISEAIYYNLPLVYADADVGAVELLKKHKTGIPYKKGDSKDLAKKIKELIENEPEKSDEAGSASSYLQEVSIKKFIEGYEQEFLQNS